MNKLESMAVFVRVVERGSFSAVATDMRLSATMVGLHVKALEEHLGVRLLNRTTRRQSLTDFGLKYYDDCRRILDDIDNSESLAYFQHQSPRGKLRIGCPVSFGVHSLSPATAEYLKSYPELTIDLVLSDKLMDMAEDRLDIMIKIGELENVNSLVARPLSSYSSIVCASPSYIEQAGKPLEPKDLIQHRCLGFANPSAGYEWTFQQDGQVIKAPINLVMAINNGEALKNAAMSGLGIIMQPEVLLAKELSQGRLVPLIPDFQPLAKPVHVLTFSDRKQLPKVSHYVEYLLTQFRQSLCY